MTRATKRRLLGAVVCIVLVGAGGGADGVVWYAASPPSGSSRRPPPRIQQAEHIPFNMPSGTLPRKNVGGLSKYKRGFDDGLTYDKLSEYPFMPVLFNGWDFGVEYNEPRGHWWMMRTSRPSIPRA